MEARAGHQSSDAHLENLAGIMGPCNPVDKGTAVFPPPVLRNRSQA
ncbi:hypothetical protein TMEN_1505 [Trichophyton mentagrophytes]|nr:hypothetical protein TMEN_1505 [Trichophyton mentagrophytes]